MTVFDHLESVEPGLFFDMLERAAIRMEAGQKEPTALREAYRETCKRKGIAPLETKR